MKIFIAGARSITHADDFIKTKLLSICQKGYPILVGDCHGVDSAIQSILAQRSYSSVTVYASNGRARNNIGHWHVKSIPVSSSASGFAFYRQKDIAMAQDADFGFMIWDGKSKGTAHNILTLAQQGKNALVYIPTTGKCTVVHSLQEAQRLVSGSNASAQQLRPSHQQNSEQLSML